MTVLGENIKKARTERGLSVRELSKISGVGASTISQIETGKRSELRSKSLEKLSKALNTDLNELTNVHNEEYEVDELSEAIGIILLDDNIKINGVVMSKAEKVEFAKYAKAIIDVIEGNRK